MLLVAVKANRELPAAILTGASNDGAKAMEGIDLYELNGHIRKIAFEYGLVASAAMIDAQLSDGSRVEPRITVTVRNPRVDGAETMSMNVSVRQFERAGLTLFDRFIRDDAAPELTGPI